MSDGTHTLLFSEELFSVWQFFADESSERVREGVTAEQAVDAAVHYCHSVGARLGTTQRVIITDGGDNIVFEWKHRVGVTFPPIVSPAAHA